MYTISEFAFVLVLGTRSFKKLKLFISLQKFDEDYTFKLYATVQDHGIPPKSSEIPLDIKIVESHKKAPVFFKYPTKPIELKEDFNDYDYNIATLEVESNGGHTDHLVFELTKNKNNNFRFALF